MMDKEKKIVFSDEFLMEEVSVNVGKLKHHNIRKWNKLHNLTLRWMVINDDSIPLLFHEISGILNDEWICLSRH